MVNRNLLCDTCFHVAECLAEYPVCHNQLDNVTIDHEGKFAYSYEEYEDTLYDFYSFPINRSRKENLDKYYMLW